MSRTKDNYNRSRWLKFKRWVGGEIDPLAHGMETVKPDPVFLEKEAKREAVRQEQEAWFCSGRSPIFRKSVMRGIRIIMRFLPAILNRA